MNTETAKFAGSAFLLAGSLALGAGCASKGPVQQVGQGIDRGVQDVKDTITPPGPVEKAGRSVDRALNR